MRYPVVLDLETKRTFRQVSDPKKLGISVAGLYDYKDDVFKSFFEDELSQLYPILEHASFIIGFNIDYFDLPVLSQYYPGDTGQFRTFDILSDIKRILGKRLSLNDVVKATLDKKKSGHGLEAIELYKKGKLSQLSKYCIDDVLLTRDLFDYGVKKGEIFYLSVSGKTPITVKWKKYLDDSRGKDTNLTLPF